jgi:hypothetical protein
MSDREFHLRKILEFLETEKLALRAALSKSEEFARQLERENAALRADRDRLNWLSSEEGNQWASRYFETMLEIPPMNRHSIDAARKEQP